MFEEGKPDLPLPLLAELATARFGVCGRMASLGSERDQNVSIIDGPLAYVLKVANLDDAIEWLDLENRIMRAAARCESLPPVPRLVCSRSDRLIETIEHEGRRFAVRLMTLLPGTAAARVPGTIGLWRDVGRVAAHLNLALIGIPNERCRPMLWDIDSAPQTRRLLCFVGDGVERKLLSDAIDVGESMTLPSLRRLPRQWIHNDLNLNNVLIDPREPTRVCGIIDFGDMVAAPRVIEPAIAAAHQCAREAEPLHAIAAVASAYHRVSPLEEGEIELLARVVVLRLAMAVLIRRARAVTASGVLSPADYAALMRTLSALHSLGVERCADAIRRSIHEDSVASASEH